MVEYFSSWRGFSPNMSMTRRIHIVNYENEPNDLPYLGKCKIAAFISRNWSRLNHVHAMHRSIMVDGVLTQYSFFHSVWNLKATQMNLQCSLIRKPLLCQFHLGYNVTVTVKDTVCHNAIRRLFKNCYSDWTRRHEFKSWTRLIAFHIALIPLGKVWIQLFSLQLCENTRADWVLQPWWGN